MIGKGEGAHYAAYLAIQHPEEFTGAGLVDGSWAGPFEKLMHPYGRPRKQIPFYVAIPTKDEKAVKAAEASAYKLVAKGYPVYLEKLEAGKDIASADVLAKVLDWLQEKSESWSKVRKDSEKRFKEKFSTGVDQFFSTE